MNDRITLTIHAESKAMRKPKGHRGYFVTCNHCTLHVFAPTRGEGQQIARVHAMSADAFYSVGLDC